MFNHKRIFKLKSSEGALFEVEEATALQSQTIKHIIEDGCANSEIPLPNVNAATLAKVIEYCNKHADPTKHGDDELKKWDANYAKVDKDVLYDLIVAANYLDIKGLLDLLSQTVADIVKARTPEQIRKYFNINNDFTQEEEEKVWNESAWAFQGQ